jgi:hypothetical protein
MQEVAVWFERRDGLQTVKEHFLQGHGFRRAGHAGDGSGPLQILPSWRFKVLAPGRGPAIQFSELLLQVSNALISAG